MDKKGIIVNSFIFTLTLGLALILLFNVKEKRETKPEPVVKEDVDALQNKINETLANLSIEEKIAQMLIVTYPDKSFSEAMQNDLETFNPGGVILFKDNITTYSNTIDLIEKIENTADIPLFMAVDQEGGKVQRFEDLPDVNITKIPPMWNLGKTKDVNLAYDVGTVIAQELRAFHINMDFAPVVDLVDNENSKFIGNRSFGNNPNTVAELATSLAQGLQNNSIVPVYKHFPGHGSTITDSHYELPILEKTKEELKTDLYPFQKAINKGAKVIMVGHLATPNLTNDNTPASLSKTIITDILRKEMNYDGLVITDALNMHALTNYYSEQEIYEMAINAGVDILLMPNSCQSAINLIKDSLTKGTITIDQIDDSVTKILELKYTSLNSNYPSQDVIGTTEHQEIINKIK